MVLLTYFEPFGKRCTNASMDVALSLPYDSIELPVRWKGIDNKLSQIQEINPDVLILLGEAGTYDKVTIELASRNHCNGIDNEGIEKISEKIDEQMPDMIYTNVVFDSSFHYSYNAGKYLCNYTYFKALSTLTIKKIVFIHVPYINENFEQIINEVNLIIDYIVKI